MSDNHHPAPSVTEADIQHAETFWTGFTKYSTYGVIAVVAILVLMATFLV